MLDCSPPALEGMTCSHAEYVAAIRDYYKFLVELFLDGFEILEPLEGGWHDITSETCGKSRVIIALLRDLPYIRERPDGKVINLTPVNRCSVGPVSCRAIADGRETLEDARIMTEPVVYLDNVPECVVGLVESKYDYGKFLLDTQLGVIYWAEGYNEIVKDKIFEPYDEIDLYSEYEELEAEWRSAETPFAIREFFETLKEQYRKMNWIPLSSRLVVEYDRPGLCVQGEEKALDEVRSVYKEHGWPDLERYEKVKCLKAVRLVLEKWGIKP